MRTALEGIGVSDIDLDCSTKSGSFKAPAGMDVNAKLNEAAESHAKLKGWTRK